MFTPMLMNACTPIHTPMPLRDRRCERQPGVRGVRAIAKRAQHEPRGTATTTSATPSEAELLGDHREQEIGVRLGQVEELLDARAEAHAEPFAAAERDQRVRQLVALAERVGPGVEEAVARCRR